MGPCHCLIDQGLTVTGNGHQRMSRYIRPGNRSQLHELGQLAVQPPQGRKECSTLETNVELTGWNGVVSTYRLPRPIFAGVMLLQAARSWRSQVKTVVRDSPRSRNVQRDV